MVQVFTIYNSWPWTSVAGRKLLVPPLLPPPTWLKFYKLPLQLGGMSPSFLMTKSKWKTLGQEAGCQLGHWKSLYQFVVSVKAYLYAQNQHHSSIQCWHIAVLISRITFGRRWCVWPHPCEWTESNRCICVCLTTSKRTTSCPNLF